VALGKYQSYTYITGPTKESTLAFGARSQQPSCLNLILHNVLEAFRPSIGDTKSTGPRTGVAGQ
jgi:hypothetical protein